MNISVRFTTSQVLSYRTVRTTDISKSSMIYGRFSKMWSHLDRLAQTFQDDPRLGLLVGRIHSKGRKSKTYYTLISQCRITERFGNSKYASHLRLTSQRQFTISVVCPYPSTNLSKTTLNINKIYLKTFQFIFHLLVPTRYDESNFEFEIIRVLN